MSEPTGNDGPDRSFRVGSLRGFLPLSDESVFSTRGQALPSLLQSQALSRTHSYQNTPDLEGSFPPEPDTPSWRRSSMTPSVLMTPQMRSQRLIGNSNPRYKWEQYWKTEEELKKMKKPIREYYERNNYLVQQYLFIDRLLDSSLPHNLIQEYNQPDVDIPTTISEEPSVVGSPHESQTLSGSCLGDSNGTLSVSKVKRTPRNLYKLPDEGTPLIQAEDEEGQLTQVVPPFSPGEEDTDSQSKIVTLAIVVNMIANTVLLALKIVVTILTSSVSVLASLVDAALDFLSTAIVWSTTRIMSRRDQYAYPVGRSRLEPIGVLVFSVIMITSFVQVAIEGINKLAGPDHAIIQLTIPAIAIMAATVVVKGLCWVWCRLIRNSSVQMLAEDAKTDVVFNTASIIFPLIGYYAKVWWLDPLGGVLLSLFVIFNWSRTSATHIRNLTGAAATADERNVLLYLTMRFAHTIKQIQGIQAYHAGDKLNVEVDLVLDEQTSLRDSHDLGESLQYVLESVPNVDRAFVHMDYTPYNIPTHMQQQE